MDVVENLRNKKLFKVHADITVHGQFTSRVIPLSISIIATNEQEAKNIARHVKITDVNMLYFLEFFCNKLG